MIHTISFPQAMQQWRGNPRFMYKVEAELMRVETVGPWLNEHCDREDYAKALEAHRRSKLERERQAKWRRGRRVPTAVAKP